MLNYNDNSERMRHAHKLYMTGHFTQNEMAQMVGISRRTLFNWIKQGKWQRVHQNTMVAPSIIAENFISSLIELQTVISQREVGYRYPTPKEMNTLFKLLTCITRLTNFPAKAIQQFALHHFNHAEAPENHNNQNTEEANTENNTTEAENLFNTFFPYGLTDAQKNHVAMGNQNPTSNTQNPENQYNNTTSHVATHEKNLGMSQQQVAPPYIDEDDDDDFEEEQEYVFECEPQNPEGLSVEERKNALREWFRKRKIYPLGNYFLTDETTKTNRPLEAHEIDFLFRCGYTGQDMTNAVRLDECA
jgi:DNA-binding XRE family transcriptional regulator